MENLHEFIEKDFRPFKNSVNDVLTKIQITLATINETTLQLKEIDKQVKHLTQVVEVGNGKPGLKIQIAELSGQIKTIVGIGVFSLTTIVGFVIWVLQEMIKNKI